MLQLRISLRSDSVQNITQEHHKIATVRLQYTIRFHAPAPVRQSYREIRLNRTIKNRTTRTPNSLELQESKQKMARFRAVAVPHPVLQNGTDFGPLLPSSCRVPSHKNAEWNETSTERNYLDTPNPQPSTRIHSAQSKTALSNKAYLPTSRSTGIAQLAAANNFLKHREITGTFTHEAHQQAKYGENIIRGPWKIPTPMLRQPHSLFSSKATKIKEKPKPNRSDAAVFIASISATSNIAQMPPESA